MYNVSVGFSIMRNYPKVIRKLFTESLLKGRSKFTGTRKCRFKNDKNGKPAL